MRCLTTLTVTLLGASTVSAASVEKHTVGGVYLCTDYDWKGCSYRVQPFNTCIGLDAPYYHHDRSMGPDKGTKCYLYSNKDCTDPVPTSEMLPGYAWRILRYPGSKDMTSLGGFNSLNWNNMLGSFRCYQE